MLNPLAEELNKKITDGNPFVSDMLSVLGKKLFFPKGNRVSEEQPDIPASRVLSWTVQ